MKKPRFLKRFIVRTNLRMSNLVQVPDNATADFLSKEYNIDRKKFFIKWWGTNPKEFKPSNKKKKIDILFLRKSSLIYSSDVFINALYLVKKKFPNIRSTIIKGDDHVRVKELIDEYGLDKNIKVLDWVNHSEIIDLINSSLIYVDSFQRNSPGSGMGVTANEAMSCELPVVLAENPGNEDYVQNNYNSLIYKQGDFEECAKHLITLLEDKTLRKRLGKNARRTIIEKLDWNKNALEIEKKYYELIKENKMGVVNG